MKPTGAFPDRAARARGAAGSRAFTIVEVAMAVAVLALAITTAITALQRSFLQLDTARNLEIASAIMQCEMEKERLLSWTQLNNVAYTPVIDAAFARNPAIGSRFTLSRALTTVASHSSQVMQIKLTVQWSSYDGHTLSRSYLTYYTQGGLYAYFYTNP